MTQHDVAPRGPDAVYLHIGAFKTGTTYLQQVLRFSHEALAEQGIAFPGGRQWREQVAGVRDLLGLSRRGGEDVDVRGAWTSLVREIRTCGMPRALVSMEFLSMAGPRQVRRAVRALEPAEVHVVLTARDLVRVIPGMWQETLKAGNTWTWAEYIAALRDPERASIPPALGFWVCQDLPAILNVWEKAVPRERIHVVTVPPPDAPPQLLLDRFCEAVGVDAGRLTLDVPWANESLGAAEAEALRRLNASLGTLTRRRDYQRVVKQVVARELARTTPRSGRMRLPGDDRVWAAKRAREMADTIVGRGYHVVGDLSDLVPDPRPAADGRAPDDVTESEVLDASTRALAELTHRLVRQRAGKGPQPLTHDLPLAQRVGSELRMLGYQARRKVAEAGTRNALAARAVTVYHRAVLRWRSRR
jgi:hypothetical protein